MNLNFSPFPELSTQRLILRQLTTSDAEQLHELRSSPEVNRHIGRMPPAELGDTKTFIKKISSLIHEGDGMYWIITLRSDTNLIGTICFWNFDRENETIEIGYELSPAYQGKGFMAEAVNCVLQYGFNQIGAKIVTGFPSEANARSVSLLEKFNFNIADKEYINIHEDDVNGMLTYILKKEHFIPNPA